MNPRAGTTLRLSTCDCEKIGLVHGKIYRVDTAAAFELLFQLRLAAQEEDEMQRRGVAVSEYTEWRYFSVHVPDSLGGWLHVVDAVENRKRNL